MAAHTASDSFVYTATGDSVNRGTENTITGFLAGGAVNDIIDVSAINPNLTIKGPQSTSTPIAADSIAWVYLGTSAFAFINDTNTALTTSAINPGLMKINLLGVSSLSASNFNA